MNLGARRESMPITECVYLWGGDFARSKTGVYRNIIYLMIYITGQDVLCMFFSGVSTHDGQIRPRVLKVWTGMV